MNHLKYFNFAKEISSFEDDRTFKLGAIGIRTDGVLVSARNGNSFSTKMNYFHRNVKSHAEGRLLRKIDSGSTIYIARIKNNNEFGLARPCKGCACMIRAKKINKVFFTIDNYSYGVWCPISGEEFVYRF